MPSLKLTQSHVLNSRPSNGQRKIDYFDTEVKGLMLEVRESGRTFYLRYRNERGIIKQKKLADAVILKLSDARKLAQERLASIAMGNDPFAEKKALKSVPTFGEFASKNYLDYVKSYKASWRTDECLLRNHILPAIGNRYMDDISRDKL